MQFSGRVLKNVRKRKEVIGFSVIFTAIMLFVRMIPYKTQPLVGRVKSQLLNFCDKRPLSYPTTNSRCLKSKPKP